MNMSRIGWPYPRTKMQVVQTVTTTFLCLAVGGVGGLLLTVHYKSQSLNHDDLQQAALSLSGYSNEGAELVGQAAHGRNLKTYRKVYLQQLGRQTQEVEDFLTTHRAPHSLAHSAKTIAQYGAELQQILEQNATESAAAKLRHAQYLLDQLHTQLEQIGEHT